MVKRYLKSTIPPPEKARYCSISTFSAVKSPLPVSPLLSVFLSVHLTNLFFLSFVIRHCVYLPNLPVHSIYLLSMYLPIITSIFLSACLPIHPSIHHLMSYARTPRIFFPLGLSRFSFLIIGASQSIYGRACLASLTTSIHAPHSTRQPPRRHRERSQAARCLPVHQTPRSSPALRSLLCLASVADLCLPSLGLGSPRPTAPLPPRIISPVSLWVPCHHFHSEGSSLLSTHQPGSFPSAPERSQGLPPSSSCHVPLTFCLIVLQKLFPLSLPISSGLPHPQRLSRLVA